MKNYELSVLFHPDLEMNLDPALDKMKGVIESAGGEIIKASNEGKKRLAYPIKGQDYGIYYYYDIALPATAPAKLSSTFNIADEVLRYLLVRADEHRIKAEARAKAKAEAKAARQAETGETESDEAVKEGE